MDFNLKFLYMYKYKLYLEFAISIQKFIWIYTKMYKSYPHGVLVLCSTDFAAKASKRLVFVLFACVGDRELMSDEADKPLLDFGWQL